MSVYKIVVTGPVGAGKTTAITSISDVLPLTTEEAPTDTTKQRKAGTTVAMDFGIMKIDGGDLIHLYGTPGQQRFSFMWDILIKGGLGLVLLVDNATEDPFGDMWYYLDAFKDFIAKTKVVIGVTRMDLNPYPRIDDYHQELRRKNVNTAIFDVDARVEQDVSILVEALIYSLCAAGIEPR